MEGFWNDTYIWIGVALLVIFFGVRAGGSIARSAAKKQSAMDPLTCSELKIGQKLELDGKLDQAAKAYQQMIDRYPDCETGYLFLGYLQKKRKDFPAAEAAFRGAFRLNPEGTDALTEIANALWASGRADEAAETYRQVIAKAPDDPEAHAALGSILDDAGQGEEAAAHLEKFVSLAGEKPSRRRASMLVEAKGRLERIKAKP
ncbi:MAG: tetratricopeptide repeat protein [Deltaproteobacteria bacterium]|nr:tetratricopeptide repeat protein [Deltaproteobacteria bacterium]